MNAANLALAEGLVSRSYIRQGGEALARHENLVKVLLSSRKLPETGWDDTTIELFIKDLALMDSNNFLTSVGVGEREARCYSKLVWQRHYGLAHGIGRSGNINDEQPKAAGSTLLSKLCNLLIKHALELAGLKDLGAVTVLPLATGMSLSMVMLALKRSRPRVAKYVLWLRIDQRSALKAITTAGFETVVVPCRIEAEEVRTDLTALEAEVKRLGADQIVCVLSTTSCFAPRGCDRIEEVAKLCQREGIGHVINNAYGVQSADICQEITKAWRRGRVDAVVQSTDKNFLVPVGGAVVAEGNRNPGLVAAVSALYPGRASSSSHLDLFITLLSLGARGWKDLLEQRATVFQHLKQRLKEVAEAHGEHVLETPHNSISLAMTLKGLEAPCTEKAVTASKALDKSTPQDAQHEVPPGTQKEVEASFAGQADVKEKPDLTFLGSMLFSRCVSGCRIIQRGDKKVVCGIEFSGYGASYDSYPCTYLTAAGALGLTKEEVDAFAVRLQQVFLDYHKKRGKGQVF